ncbi:NAD(+) diphosphatase [Lichenicoccus sp.]|uniref:NAD(+) diphosphatase n=1 Tax=Lichenicoccus sp. TaxID=2781899 RepID=UPI003D14DCF4
MHANFFTGNPLDRVSALRDDAAVMLALRDDPSSRFLPVWRDQHLMRHDALRVAMPSREALIAELGPIEAHPSVLLGLRDERALFALDLSKLEEPQTQGIKLGHFEPLRPLAPLLPTDEAAILAQARGMLHWRRLNVFCGRCASRTNPEQGGSRLVCPNCGLQQFPRTDPVAIMLVHHEGRALLARGTRFPGRRLFSALAGFIEPGESAEEAVARETFEETGIRLARIDYHSSQPWPFPGSLMLGFLAEATGHALTLDPAEIAEAHWLTPTELRDPAHLDIELPGPIAIARSLIDAWLAAQ